MISIPYLFLVLINRVQHLLLQATTEETALAHLVRLPAACLPSATELLASSGNVKLKDDNVRKERIKMEQQLKWTTQAARPPIYTYTSSTKELIEMDLVRSQRHSPICSLPIRNSKSSSSTQRAGYKRESSVKPLPVQPGNPREALAQAREKCKRKNNVTVALPLLQHTFLSACVDGYGL